MNGKQSRQEKRLVEKKIKKGKLLRLMPNKDPEDYTEEELIKFYDFIVKYQHLIQIK